MNPDQLVSLDRAIGCTLTHRSRGGVSESRSMKSDAPRMASKGHLAPPSLGEPAPAVGSSWSCNRSTPAPHHSSPPCKSTTPHNSHTSLGGSYSATTHSHRRGKHPADNSVQAVSRTPGRSSSWSADLDVGTAATWRRPALPPPGHGGMTSAHGRSAPQSRTDHHKPRHRQRDSDHQGDSEDDSHSLSRRKRRRYTEPPVQLTAEASDSANLSPSRPGGLFGAVESLLPVSSGARCILAFDAKLIELLYCLSPSSEERETKLRVIDDIRATMQRTGIDIQIYGSLCTGLMIPASDVDCVLMRSGNVEIAGVMAQSMSAALSNIASASEGIMSSKSIKGSLSTAVRTVADRMRRSSTFTHVTCIAHAKVPIVKCRHRRDNVKVDLSFERNGCVSSNYLCQQFCEPGNEMVRPLIVLVKALVNHSRLDDPSIGGLGSFPIALLVLWYVRQCVRTRFARDLQQSIGTLLTGFLKYYGTEFDFRRFGIDYVQQKTFAKAPANDLFIVNPVCPGSNCAKAATLFATRIVPLFQRAATTFVDFLDTNAAPLRIESQLLSFFANAASGVRSWADVSRQAARESHRQQNMWDSETNMYVGGVL